MGLYSHLTAFTARVMDLLEKLRQVHLSEVNASSKHEPLNMAATNAFRNVAHLIPESVPVILETPVLDSELDNEVSKARTALRIDSVQAV